VFIGVNGMLLFRFVFRFMLVYASTYSNGIFRGRKRRSMRTPTDGRKVTSACVNITYRANLSRHIFIIHHYVAADHNFMVMVPH